MNSEQLELIIWALSDKIVALKGKNGTEFTQARLCEIIEVLNEQRKSKSRTEQGEGHPSGD